MHYASRYTRALLQWNSFWTPETSRCKHLSSESPGLVDSIPYSAFYRSCPACGISSRFRSSDAEILAWCKTRNLKIFDQSAAILGRNVSRPKFLKAGRATDSREVSPSRRGRGLCNRKGKYLCALGNQKAIPYVVLVCSFGGKRSYVAIYFALVNSMLSRYEPNVFQWFNHLVIGGFPWWGRFPFCMFD